MSDKRLDILDGFRCVAIVSVLFFHFYSKWTFPVKEENYLPGENVYHTDIFNHGNLGVQFFFIISGFVIFYTLERSETLIAFLIKRFIKLFPTMLLCSVVTFLAIPLLDSYNEYPNFHSRFIDFLPSLTFTPPSGWQRLFNDPDIDYINGSYWSLWPEVVFYFVAGITYFSNKKLFVRNWFVLIFVALVTNVLYMLFSNLPITARPLIPGARNHLYFSLGILFYCLHKSRKVSAFSYLTIVLLSIYTLVLAGTPQRVGFVVMVSLFLLFIYKQEWVSFFKWKFLTTIGLVSYSLYLIHENIGVVLINRLATLTGTGVLAFLLPLLVSALCIVFSILVFQWYEKPVDYYLKKRLARFIHPQRRTGSDKNDIRKDKAGVVISAS
ncbi:MAG TPA: acyltransferase [Flavitalea sp.]|nr:acyltransferase [Flavitalea sp.]